MRKLLSFAAAIAVLGVAGVAGAAKPAAVTISAAKPIVVYGHTVKLSGKVGNHNPGEQVIVLGPAAPVGQDQEPGDEALEGALAAELAAGASTRDAAAAVAGRLGVSRRRAYTLATSLRKAARS